MRRTTVWLVVGLGWTATIAPAGEPTVERWVQRAWENHPSGVAAKAGPESERVQVAGTRAWMPPSAEFDYQSDGLVSTKFVQMIPWPGKTGSMEAVQKAKVEMARSDSGQQWRILSLSVREAAWMEWMTRTKARLLREQEVVVRSLIEAAQRNQAQGMATASDVWLLRSRAEQVAGLADQAEAEARSARAMREGWTGIVSDSLAPSTPIPPTWDDSSLLREAERRPDVSSMRRESQMREAMGAASAASLKPDIMAGGMVMMMANGMPGWGVMAGLTLPFVPWASGMADGQAKGSRAQARIANSKADAMVRMARSEVSDHSDRARGAWAAWKRLDSLVLPGLDQALSQTRSRYGQGREMLSMVLSMEEMVRMTRMDAVMRRGEYELERARLSSAAGLEPDALEAKQ